MPDAMDKHWHGKFPKRTMAEEMRQRAIRLRQQTTPAENRLWSALKGKQRLAYKFRRQHVIGPFIVDFYCAKASLVIEVDGPSHANQADYDAERTHVLDGLGLHVLRFSNDDVLNNLAGVVAVIEAYLSELQP